MVKGITLGVVISMLIIGCGGGGGGSSDLCFDISCISHVTDQAENPDAIALQQQEERSGYGKLHEPKILGVWCAAEKSSKHNCAGKFDFKNNHLLMGRKSYKYWHISKYKRIFSRETYRVEFSLGKSTEVRVNLNDGRDGVIFISECDTNLRKCLTDYYVRKSVIRDEKRLGYLIGKYEDVL